MTKRLLLVLAAVAAVLIPAVPAAAHNPLVEATPAKNATVKKAPTVVKLTFLEKLNAGSTKLTVTGPDGPASGAAAVSGKSVSVSFAEPLPNGKYTVAYQLTADDGDVIKSSYTFTVSAPEASAPVSAPASTSAFAPASTSASAPAGAPSASTAPVVAAQVTSATPAAQAIEPTSDDSNGPWLGLVAGIGILVLAAAAIFVFVRRRNAAK
jgi:methionine-rich copper-binding protein CopC